KGMPYTRVKHTFFFFSSRRRHTRWPRDWSSDMCSSDLLGQADDGDDGAGVVRRQHDTRRFDGDVGAGADCDADVGTSQGGSVVRSEERRVGKECRSGGARAQERKKVDRMLTLNGSTVSG